MPAERDRELIRQARQSAALLLQAHARRRHARARYLKLKGANRSIVPSTGCCAGQRLHTTVDRLSSAIDNVVYVEERLPFLIRMLRASASLYAAVVEVLRAAGANPLVGTSINASSFAIAANTARQRALGAALPALQEALQELEVAPGARLATERPLSLKLAKRDAAARLLVKQRHGHGAESDAAPAAAAAAAAEKKAAEAKQALGSYRKPSSLSSFYRLKNEGSYGEQALLPKILAPYSVVATGGGCGYGSGRRRNAL